MAHIKIIDPSGWSFERPTAQLIKVSSRGLVGSDRSEFLKTASAAFLPFLDSLDIPKDVVPVHHIAVGATEAYGPNRNGDGFKEATCKAWHHTFTKSAKLYRNHANKDPKNSFGVIKLSAYNDQMRRIELLAFYNATKEAAARTDGHVADREIEKLEKGEDLPGSMACVLDPTYPVLTRDRGYVGIADVVVGDHVWTCHGRWRRVTAVNRRVYTGEVRRFRVNGLASPLEITADHPMYAKLFVGSREVAAVKAKAKRYFSDPSAFEHEPAGWQHASHIQSGDRFFYRPVTRYDGYGAIADQSLAALMGYYLAEGSFGYNGEKACTVSFACNMSDSLLRRVPRLMEQIRPDVLVKIRGHHNSNRAMLVEIHDTDFAEYLRQFVGVGAKHKTIAPEIFNADEGVKLAFLGAWLDGDGWGDKKGMHWSTCNLGLALQGRDLLASIGVASSIYAIDHAKCKTSGYENSGIEYTLNISHLDAWRLSGYSTKVAEYPVPNLARQQPPSMRACHDGSYAYRVKTVETRQVVDTQTYNIEVEEDESYSLGGLISHNCRVPFDVCSSCKNKARTRNEYCGPQTCKHGGCRDNLAKVASDGHILHVDNPDPHFFDYSYVFRPADRTAYGTRADYLQKAASALQLPETLSTAPLAVCLSQLDSLLVDNETRGQIKLAVALALIEQRDTVLPVAGYRGCDPVTYPELTATQMQRLDRPGSEKCAAALAALADQAVVLDFKNFANWMDKSAFYPVAAKMLPHIFTHIATRDDAETFLQSNPFRCVTKHASADGQALARELRIMSLSPSATQERAIVSAIKSASFVPAIPQPWSEKLATAAPGSLSLAEAYAMYKLAALVRMTDRASVQDFDLTSRLILGQNRV